MATGSRPEASGETMVLMPMGRASIGARHLPEVAVAMLGKATVLENVRSTGLLVTPLRRHQARTIERVEDFMGFAEVEGVASGHPSTVNARPHLRQ